MQQIRTVSIGEVQAFLQNHPGGFLIDVLPPEFHVQQHIPGSSGVCVFETAFQKKMGSGAGYGRAALGIRSGRLFG